MTTSTDTTNPSEITRRNAFTTSLAGVLLVAAPVLAQAADALPGVSEASTELYDLEREYWDAWTALDRSCTALAAAEAAKEGLSQSL